MTTVSFVGSFPVLSLGTILPVFEFTCFSSAFTTIFPSRTVAENDQSESNPGASSMSPVHTLKQAMPITHQPRPLREEGAVEVGADIPPCHGQTIRPSWLNTPFSRGAP